MANAVSTCCGPTGVQELEAVTFRPRVDIRETAEEYRIHVDMPGVAKDDVELRFEDGKLAIHGKVAVSGNSERSYHVREYRTGDFVREFRLGEGIDHEAISAEMSDGVLTVGLPKVGAVRPRKIDVR